MEWSTILDSNGVTNLGPTGGDGRGIPNDALFGTDGEGVGYEVVFQPHGGTAVDLAKLNGLGVVFVTQTRLSHVVGYDHCCVGIEGVGQVELLGDGYSVTLDDWGTFKATLGLEEGKEKDTIDGSESKRNARSLYLNGINFQADKKLVRNARQRCKLERAGIVRVKRSPYTKEERLQKALGYLEENKVLKVSQYMELTGLAHTTAANELRAFSRDSASGIISVGRGPAVVYVKK